ncbi:MAG: hypothetical protein ABIO92_07860 [Chloroflexia bacterium]
MPRTYEHNRRSLRLKDYDYSVAGAHFVTICTQGHVYVCLFGQAIEGRIELSDARETVTKRWEKIPSKFPTIEIDSYVVMPNHFHGILVITKGWDAPGQGGHVGPPLQTLGCDEQGGHVGPPLRCDLPGVIQWFKTMTTNEYIRGVKQSGWPAFNGKLWQRTY